MRKDNTSIPEPDISTGHYLLTAMMDVGPVQSNGMAIIPTAWAEIDAFGRATGILSEPWEYVALRKMCVAYFAGMKSGEDVFSIPPMERDE